MGLRNKNFFLAVIHKASIVMLHVWKLLKLFVSFIP